MCYSHNVKNPYKLGLSKQSFTHLPIIYSIFNTQQKTVGTAIRSAFKNRQRQRFCNDTNFVFG